MIHELVKQKYFEISSGSEEALYLQIRKGFVAWIHDNDQGFEFPSERELAIFLDVNRRTLRQALMPLFQSGVLARKGYKMFINHKIGTCTNLQNSFLLSDSGTKHILKFLLLDGMPSHAEFWNQVIGEFNRQSPVYELSPVGFYGNAAGNPDYWKNIEQETFDLAVLPVSYRWKKGVEEHLLPVRESMKEYFHSEEFLTGDLTGTSSLLRDYAYPYLFTFQTAKYCKPYHVLSGTHVRELSFEEVLKRAVKEVPPEIPLFNIYYDICRDLGALKDITPETVRNHCEIILKRLDILKGRENVFAMSGFTGKGWCAKYADKLFCQHHFSVELLKNGMEKNAENTVFMPRKDSYFWGGCSSIGICRSSENQQAALLFINFLLSEPVQNMIWKYFRSAPVRVSSLSTVDLIPEKALSAYLRSCRENPKSYPPPVGSVMLPYFEQYLNGTVSREKIIEDVQRFYT